MRIWDFLRREWVVVVFLAAIVGSFVASNQESENRDRAQATQLVAGCSRTSERSVLDAAFKQKTSDVRRASGKAADVKAADEYEKFALGGVALVPLPARVERQIALGKMNPRKALIGAVEVSHNPAGDAIYRLTPAAKKVLREGCVEAYS